MTQAQVRSNFIKSNPGVRRFGKKGFWYRCAHCGKWCGRPGTDNVKIRLDERMEVDHIRPWSQGGSDSLYNLQALCHNCNRRKSSNPTVIDSLKMVKNDVLHGDFIGSSLRQTVRSNKILKKTGLVKRK